MHFYEKLESGEIIPQHFTPMTTKEGLRPTRVADVQKWWADGKNVRPSVTTVYDVLGKPALNNWFVEQHLEQAYSQSKQEWIDPADGRFIWNDSRQWIEEIKRLTELQMDKAPSAGSDFHEWMHKAITGQTTVNRDLCESVMNVIREKTETEPLFWKAEENFVSDMGYGGQVDLITPDWIIDYKTKQKADKFKPGKMVYEDHSVQLAAYREAVNPKARVANCFVCLEDGQIEFVEHTQDQLVTGWRIFHHCLGIWYLRHGEN